MTMVHLSRRPDIIQSFVGTFISILRVFYIMKVASLKFLSIELLTVGKFVYYNVFTNKINPKVFLANDKQEPVVTHQLIPDDSEDDFPTSDTVMAPSEHSPSSTITSPQLIPEFSVGDKLIYWRWMYRNCISHFPTN